MIETELRPLVQAAFERHQPIEVDHHRGGRQVEQDEGQQPEDDVRRSEFAGDTDPRQADDEEDLREGEIANAELFLQRRAVLLDARLGACECGGTASRGFGRRVVVVSGHALASPAMSMLPEVTAHHSAITRASTILDRAGLTVALLPRHD